MSQDPWRAARCRLRDHLRRAVGDAAADDLLAVYDAAHQDRVLTRAYDAFRTEFGDVTVAGRGGQQNAAAFIRSAAVQNHVLREADRATCEGIAQATQGGAP